VHVNISATNLPGKGGLIDVRPAPRSGILATALWALDWGGWPIPLYGIGDKRAKKPDGKEPLGGKGWGLNRPDESFLKATCKREPNANLGLKLGPDGRVIDLDVDDAEAAAPTLARLFPGGIPQTLGWRNAGGKHHLAFLWDDRLARYAKAVIKGPPHYPGLELRIGCGKQSQSVIPPSLLPDASARKWNGTWSILPLPESVFADLDAHAIVRPARRTRAGDDRPPPTADRYAAAALTKEAEAVRSASEGSRNEALNRAAYNLGQLIPGGSLDQATVEAELADAAADAGLSEREIGATLRSGIESGKANPRDMSGVGRAARNGHHHANGTPRQPPPNEPPRGRATDVELSRRPRTDLGNAERLVARHGPDLRFCHPWKRWLVWDGRRWKDDDTGRARHRARHTVRSILAEAMTIDDDERRKGHAAFALASEKRDRITALLYLAEAEAGVPILPGEMDSDPWLFNCKNGTIDLRTGELRPHRREDLITKLCDVDYDPEASCPLWRGTLDKFFARADPGRQAGLVDYWQRLCGYALTGVVRDHLMPIAFGKGDNGKSTILGTLIDVFGPDYAMKCPPDMLMAKKTDSHPTDRADLFGKRLVVALETAEGRRLNETMVKELTGGDAIRARRMHENFWEFKPTHTLMMATNHKPVIRGTDTGIWRRLKLVPFTVRIGDAEAIKDMPERLRAEWPGVLAWCVRGCLEWQRRGLDTPEEVTEATAGYRAEQDVIGLFLGECTKTGPNLKVKAGELYERYAAWAEKRNEYALSMPLFSEAIQERDFEKKVSNGKWYLGLGLVQESGENGRESGVF
jgi:P4 family phage/plasmid primase-like protien